MYQCAGRCRICILRARVRVSVVCVLGGASHRAPPCARNYSAARVQRPRASCARSICSAPFIEMWRSCAHARDRWRVAGCAPSLLCVWRRGRCARAAWPTRRNLHTRCAARAPMICPRGRRNGFPLWAHMLTRSLDNAICKSACNDCATLLVFSSARPQQLA